MKKQITWNCSKITITPIIISTPIAYIAEVTRPYKPVVLQESKYMINFKYNLDINSSGWNSKSHPLTATKLDVKQSNYSIGENTQ